MKYVVRHCLGLHKYRQNVGKIYIGAIGTVAISLTSYRLRSQDPMQHNNSDEIYSVSQKSSPPP